MLATLTTPAVVQSGDGKVFQFPTIEQAQQFEADVQQAGGETLRLVPEVLPAARPLYDLEAHLAALVDTEELVPEELEAQYATDLQAALTAAVEKRDRVGQFRCHLVSQIAFAHTEAQRLREREDFYQRVLERMDGYITRVIESLGLDAKGKRLKLEGKVATLSLHGCDKRAEVLEEEAVPSKYKRVTITLPVDTWESLCDSLDLDVREQVLAEVKSPKIEVSLSAVKADLKAGVDVPNARLTGGSYVVVK